MQKNIISPNCAYQVFGGWPATYLVIFSFPRRHACKSETAARWWHRIGRVQRSIRGVLYLRMSDNSKSTCWNLCTPFSKRSIETNSLPSSKSSSPSLSSSGNREFEQKFDPLLSGQMSSNMSQEQKKFGQGSSYGAMWHYVALCGPTV